MNPRLMVMCLGGLAGTGALVCCDLDEGLEAQDTGTITEDGVETLEAGEAVSDAPVMN